MGKQKLSGGDVTVGKLSVKGAISTATGSVTAALGVNAGTQGYTISVASVTLKRARVAVSAATTGERTYGLTFAAGDVIKNVYLDVSTREQTATTKTIDVGLLSSETGGDADGFLDGVSTASIQIVQGSLVAGSVTRGALLSEGTATSGVYATGKFPKSHVIHGANATTLSSTVAEAQTELVADIIVEYETIG